MLLEFNQLDKNCCGQWKREVGKEIVESDEFPSSKYILDMSANIAIRKAFFKIRNRWYLVPTRLHKMFPQQSDYKCWRCTSEWGSMVHIWWTCSQLKGFWMNFHREISWKIGILFHYLPECCLLHLFTSMNKFDTVLLNNLLLAARMLIAKYWKSSRVPTIQEWRIKCLHILLMNQLWRVRTMEANSRLVLFILPGQNLPLIGTR